ncbi:MAG: TRL domain-containing protein [Bullifex sp.]
MKKIVSILIALVVLVSLMSCTTVTPLAATSNPVGEKVGHASATYLFGFIPLTFKADHGIQKAAKDGNITEISTVDVKQSWYVLWSNVSTVVTGK